MAKVDIVVPCYNYGRFLETCVGSILCQSVRDLRVLIIDDASSDDSLSTARKLAKADARISIISHARNQGHIRTYNEGIAWASADYFLLLSADDLLAPGALRRATEVMDRDAEVVLTHGKGFVWYDSLPSPQIEVGQSHAFERQDLIRDMCMTGTNFVFTPTAIVRTCTQKAVGGYEESLPHSGDMEMWLRLAAHGVVIHIGAIQAIYRVHSFSMSNSHWASTLSDCQECKKAFDLFFQKHPNRAGSLRVQSDRMVAARAFQGGMNLVRRGQIRSALPLLRWSMDLDPRLRYFPPLWKLLKMPGPVGRGWAATVIKEATGRLLGRT